MKKARLNAVVMEKPKLLFLVAINALAAFVTQVFFAVLMFGNMKQLEHILPAHLTSEELDQMIISAVFINAILTALLMGVFTYSLERFPIFDIKKVRGKEFLRAMYFSIAGMALVCATKMIFAGLIPQAIGLIVLALILLVLGGYLSKFGEARRGIWFPHIVFHYLIQQFIFFPLGWWIVGRSLQ